MASPSFKTANFLEINLAMLFLSTSGAFGKYIALPAPLTIAARVFLAFFFLFLYCKLNNISFDLSHKDRWPIILSAVLLGFHWVGYFHSLQLSNVAIGMLALFTFPVMTAFLEPLFLKVRFQKMHLLLGVLVLTGIYLLVPEFSFDNSYTAAIAIGLLSALCYAVRNLILKTKVDRYQGSLLMTYQMGIVAFLMLPLFFFYELKGVGQYWEAIMGLVLITTVIGHTMFVNCFKYFSMTTVSILSCVQPVYGILIGAFFLGEIPDRPTILGGVLILLAVVIESIRSYR